MHYLMLVTLELWPDATSQDARDDAYGRLAEDSSFCGEGGRFGCPLADWFVIGGRWSGYLRQSPLGKPYEEALAQEFPQFTNDYFDAELPNLHKHSLDELWQRFGGTGSHPLTRSSYVEHGEEDDAMLVDKALYDHFLKPLAGTDVCLDDKDLHRFADLDGDEVDDSFIGRKWLVVVDYHS